MKLLVLQAFWLSIIGCYSTDVSKIFQKYSQSDVTTNFMQKFLINSMYFKSKFNCLTHCTTKCLTTVIKETNTESGFNCFFYNTTFNISSVTGLITLKSDVFIKKRMFYFLIVLYHC